MDINNLNVSVVGAGIGGLATALVLARQGARVTVLEQAEQIKEVGAGLQISPNGLAVLDALGLRDDLSWCSQRGRAVVLRNHHQGGQVLRLDLEQYAPDQRFYFVHRSDLISILADAVRAEGVKIRLLQKAERIEPGPSPRIHLANGAVCTSNLVIGADGLHSKARLALNGVKRPFFTGQVAWRAVVPNTIGLRPEANVFMGPGRHLVAYPLRDGSLVNIVAVEERRDWVAEGWAQRDDPANLRRAFKGFGGDARALLDEVEEVGLWGLFRHPVAEHWQADGVALIGDAAHPTLPFMAQGANLALEDAWILASCLKKADSKAEALVAYQNMRRDRAAKVVDAATGNAWKYHLRAPLRWPAHQVLRLAGRFAPQRMVSQFDWIYRHDVTG